MKFAILGLLVVLFIAFCVVVWKAAREWRWYQIVAVIFCMILAIILMFPTANVLKSRAAWHELKEDLEERLTRIKIEQEEIKYGDPTDADAEGIVQLTQRLSVLGQEAGRRWRNLAQTQLTPQGIILTKIQPAEVVGLPAADDEAAPAAPVGPMIPEGLVVYGFAETDVVVNPDQQITMRIPTVFLGEFRVKTSTPTQVTITTINALRPEQVQLLQRAQTWTLYETLPLDAHRPFVASGSVPSDDEFFGHMDEALVRGLLGQGVSEESIQEYLRDGTRATDNDAPETRWKKIEFLKRYEIEVDSPDQRGALVGSFFDGNGRAVDSRLQIGEPGKPGKVLFNIGDQVLIKEEPANELILEKTAKLVDVYYIRELNDYRFVLRRLKLQLAEIVIRKKEIEDEKNVLDAAIRNTVQMIGDNQDAKLKLEQDLAQAQIEKGAIEKYTNTIAIKLKAMRDASSALHRKNLELEQKLNRYHREIEGQIESLSDRSASTTADAPGRLVSTK